MQVTCIKCHNHGTLSINSSTSNGHTYRYYMVQHYHPETKKHIWCYIGTSQSLPEQYQTIIHKNQSLSTKYPQNTNNLNYSPITQTNTEIARGCRLVWSRLRDSGSRDLGSNPSSPTNTQCCHLFLHLFGKFRNILICVIDLVLLMHMPQKRLQHRRLHVDLINIRSAYFASLLKTSVFLHISIRTSSAAFNL